MPNTPSHARILIVDDDPRTITLLEDALRPHGYEVATAVDGDEALQRAMAGGIDVVVLDLATRGLDGFDLTRRLRSDPRTRLVPIVLITAPKAAADRVKGLDAGCDDFLAKPFDAPQAVARVKTVAQIGYYRSLLADKQQLDDVIHQAPDGIVLLAPAGFIARMNRQAATLLDVDADQPPRDLLGHLRQRFTIAHQGDLRQELARAPLVFELERPETGSARPRVIAVRSSPIRDPLGHVSGIVLTLDDITDSRRQESHRQELLGGIAHKLRAPINVITDHACMIQEEILGPLTADQRDAMRTILGNTQSLTALIDQLLALATASGQTLNPASDGSAGGNARPPRPT